MGWNAIYQFVTGGGSGQPGPRGQDAAAWLNGQGPPAASLGKQGDYYLQTTTGQVWNKISLFFGVAAAWKAIANLMGPPGKVGAQGPAGPQGPPGSMGPLLGGSSGGAVVFTAANGSMTTDAAQFFWDDTNHRLGIGTNSPKYPIHISEANQGVRLDYDANTTAFYTVYPNLAIWGVNRDPASGVVVNASWAAADMYCQASAGSGSIHLRATNTNGGLPVDLLVLTPTTITVTNSVTSYNGDSTAGNGLASVVGTVALTGQTTAQGPTTIFKTNAAGLYRFSYYLLVTSAGGKTVNVSAEWVDPVGSESVSSSTTASFVQGSVVMQCTAGSNIQFSNALSGSGSVTYSIYIAVERLV